MCTDVVKAPNPSVGSDAIEGTRHAFQVLRALVIANPGDATRVHKGSNGDHGNGSSGSIVVIFSSFLQALFLPSIVVHVTSLVFLLPKRSYRNAL